MKEKVVIVTGASSGIGRACANEFASRGANVVIAARRVDLLEELKSSIQEKYNVQVLAVKTDVAVEEDCINLVKQTVDCFGKIDVLINNAGISMRAIYAEMSMDVLRKVMDINFWGTAYCTRYALPYLLETKGSVAAVSSISGYSPLPARTAYSASKSAIHGLLESLRIENRKTGLHVFIIAPGYTTSDIRKNALAADGSAQGETPRDEEKMLKPEQVAREIAIGIIKRKRTRILGVLGWWTVAVYKVFPGLVNHIMYGYIKKEPDSPFK